MIPYSQIIVFQKLLLQHNSFMLPISTCSIDFIIICFKELETQFTKCVHILDYQCKRFPPFYVACFLKVNYESNCLGKSKVKSMQKKYFQAVFLQCLCVCMYWGGQGFVDVIISFDASFALKITQQIVFSLKMIAPGKVIFSQSSLKICNFI